ncbi:hypothetical protein CDAR_521861 [Caerostris darwini]|uniref:Uncharacterized protein n=1 Tax=Caerostris darwini TaxID=1538125 RepID=A0AAV4RWB2_9ARAC|nr:hypothetical protein CDAR_521861 [Caerostris darwini]
MQMRKGEGVVDNSPSTVTFTCERRAVTPEKRPKDVSREKQSKNFKNRTAARLSCNPTRFRNQKDCPTDRFIFLILDVKWENMSLACFLGLDMS